MVRPRAGCMRCIAKVSPARSKLNGTSHGRIPPGTAHRKDFGNPKIAARKGCCSGEGIARAKPSSNSQDTTLGTNVKHQCIDRGSWYRENDLHRIRCVHTNNTQHTKGGPAYSAREGRCEQWRGACGGTRLGSQGSPGVGTPGYPQRSGKRGVDRLTDEGKTMVNNANPSFPEFTHKLRIARGRGTP